MLNKIFKKEIVTLKKYKPIFTTTDGKVHEGHEYKWAIEERLRCSIPEYLMIDIKSDGYIKDVNDIMYMLTNVISIEWKLLKDAMTEDTFNSHTIFVNDVEC